MRIIIEKRSYSSHPWRLIDAETGLELTAPSPLKIGDREYPPWDRPLGGNTKTEAIEELGRLAGAAIKRLEALTQQEGER